jgi:crossover junction endodeoxyribonuclease RuvC
VPLISIHPPKGRPHFDRLNAALDERCIEASSQTRRGLMVFFGVDPGTNATGYGVIDVRENTVRWKDSGVVVPAARASLPEKLETIYDRLHAKMQEHGPACVCVEQAFYAKNVHTTLILGHARGVALLAARKCGATVVEFSPLEIKKAVVGNGHATKDQVLYMINALLSPTSGCERLDASDALAAALCAYYHYGNNAVLRKAMQRV